MKKKVLITIGVVVVIAIIIANFAGDTSDGIEVRADIVKTRDLVETVSASGRIQPQTKVDITAQITNEIIALPVEEGDRVEAGDLLVVLDTVQVQSDVDQARYSVNEINARLEGAEASLEQAEEEYERQQRLYESNLTSETAYKNARYAFQNAKASYNALQAQAAKLASAYEKVKDNLRKSKIVAPMSGVITFLDAEVGEIAAAQTGFTAGRVLMTISNLDVFEVEVEVDETEIAKIELGQEASIEVDAFPDTTFNGEVVEIGNTAIMAGAGQDQSTNFRVKVIFSEQKAKIRPGMSATVDITTAKRDEAITVPFSSVVMRTLDLDSLEAARAGEQAAAEEDGNAVHAAEREEDADEGADTEAEQDEAEELRGVFVIRDKVARFVPVETGIADQRYIEVMGDLQPGDSVVSGPYRVLRTVADGDEVEPELEQPNGNT
ncbi:efflux RND transporter periplasmic adaptor subunit [candidate division GN15 bacterium]|nr:efflux RND transporter periplasmic adaptor subunit [candidate division GN15 bacterium]